MHRDRLVDYLDTYLNVVEIRDYGPQGLQVETSNEEVRRIALAVDTAPAVIAAAADWNADMLLVHHGILWRTVERIAGPLGARVRALMNSGINLYAAHLPLDAHTEVGNNAELARLLNIKIEQWWCMPTGTPIGVFGPLKTPQPREQLVATIDATLATTARLLAYGPPEVHQVALVSGAGSDRVAEAVALGADTLITGETSHADYWAASDHRINVIFAGHYATETVGVRALGRHLEKQFDLTTKFFDFPTHM